MQETSYNVASSRWASARESYNVASSMWASARDILQRSIKSVCKCKTCSMRFCMYMDEVQESVQ